MLGGLDARCAEISHDCVVGSLEQAVEAAAGESHRGGDAFGVEVGVCKVGMDVGQNLISS